MDDKVLVFPEPPREFRYGQAMADPHDGLAIFGPYDAEMPPHPRNISYALVGPARGTDAFVRLCELIQSPIETDPDLDRRLWPMFPGFEVAFACSWPVIPSRVVDLEEPALILDSRDKDPNKRAARVVEKYLSGIERIHRRDDPVDVVICVVPDIVYENCRPKSRIAGGVGYAVSPRVRRERQHGQTD